MDDYNTALDLVNKINEANEDSVFSIAHYDSGWKIVGVNGGEFDTNNFNIVPGKGYLIKMKRDTTVTFSGKEIIYESDSDSAPINFNPGWNLVGLYGTNTKSYTAESLIDGINGYSEAEITADNVTRWPVELGRYQGLQKEEGEVYGFDFPLVFSEAYFVRVVDGGGIWQPEIE